ncbi:hypothetical protein BD410DRAFT_845462 [Rickenella mellea]|uniref:Uncharacterized protein n=1 Tax=Rickenella mellea TaxID=50990 RepID=A0A4Y7PKP9_9AGAM|nr:hypothetical protein BD410DRAFT_845462 [Rickenella mellea]
MEVIMDGGEFHLVAYWPLELRSIPFERIVDGGARGRIRLDGGNEFVRFRDNQETSTFDIASALEKMEQKNRIQSHASIRGNLLKQPLPLRDPELFSGVAPVETLGPSPLDVSNLAERGEVGAGRPAEAVQDADRLPASAARPSSPTQALGTSSKKKAKGKCREIEERWACEGLDPGGRTSAP